MVLGRGKHEDFETQAILNPKPLNPKPYAHADAKVLNLGNNEDWYAVSVCNYHQNVVL